MVEHDPFWGLGFQPIGGGFDHLPPVPSLAEVMGAAVVLKWSRIARRGIDYDLGRFRAFVEVEPQSPIVILWGSFGYRLADGRHRLGAAWLAGRPTVRALVAPCLHAEPWCA